MESEQLEHLPVLGYIDIETIFLDLEQDVANHQHRQSFW